MQRTKRLRRFHDFLVSKIPLVKYHRNGEHLRGKWAGSGILSRFSPATKARFFSAAVMRPPESIMKYCT